MGRGSRSGHGGVQLTNVDLGVRLIKELKATIESYVNPRGQLQQGMLDQIAVSLQQIEALDFPSKVAALEQDIEGLKKEAEGHKETNHQVTSMWLAAQEEKGILISMKDLIAAKRREMADLDARVAAANTQVADADKKLADADKKLADTNAQLADANGQMASVTEKLKALRTIAAL